MVSLRFFGGVGEIGGNKILLEDNDTKIFLDFGQSFTFGQDYYTGYLQPRKPCFLKDCFEFGMLPKLSGLYSEDELSCTDIKYTRPEIDAILISHAHFDHCAHLELVDPKIPVYCGKTTKLFLEAMEDTSNGTDYGEHEFRLFTTGDKLKIGAIEAEPIHVDHSIPGAYGYLLHTSEGCVAYTGDLRMHGPMHKMTEEFIEKAKEEKPIALITEGTRVAPEETRKPHTEAYVKEKSSELVSNQKNLAIATFYGRDIDRINTFHSVAKETGRKFVISMKTAYLLDKLKGSGMKIPDPLKDKEIGIYPRKKKSGNYEENDYFKWERPYLSNPVYAEEIRKGQGNFLLSLNFLEFGELIDIRPKEGSVFIHSMSEPFSEEDVEEEIKQNWISHFSLDFQQLHASGHCNCGEIGALVEKINAKKVFPVHTEHPELFSSFSKQVTAPKPEVKYPL